MKFIVGLLRDEKYTLTNAQKLQAKMFFNESSGLVLVVVSPKFSYVSSRAMCVIYALY